MAKHIIHLILCLQRLIAGDPEVSPWLRVVMVENYNVAGGITHPACDLSRADFTCFQRRPPAPET